MYDICITHDYNTLIFNDNRKFTIFTIQINRSHKSVHNFKYVKYFDSLIWGKGFKGSRIPGFEVSEGKGNRGDFH